MKWLFIHQNFPGQFVHAARHLAAAGDTVVFITQRRGPSLPGIRKIEYVPAAGPASHPYLLDLNTGIANGLAVAAVCSRLQNEGFVPDLVVGHNGWGETLHVKDVWPNVPLLGYFEFFYRSEGSDVSFDPEFPPEPDFSMRLRIRNAVNLLGLDAADWGQTPTQWQRDQYPQCYWDRISIIHEGVDTTTVRPDTGARIWLQSGVSLSRDDEVITYSARNLEPYRGFHVFMRALPRVLRRRPNARVVIIGGHDVSYGRRPVSAANWRQSLMNELSGKLDVQRIHFLGHLPYRQYLTVLQLSSVHVYLTYPFVLSWSLLEAMAAGCLVVGSRTPPVEEVVKDGENGLLVDFFDIEALASRISNALAQQEKHRRIRRAARETVVGRYDLKTICLPEYLNLLQRLSNSGRRSVPVGAPGEAEAKVAAGPVPERARRPGRAPALKVVADAP